MYANNLPVPADRMIPAWSPTPQFAVQYNQPTQWQAYIPLITQQCATIIGNSAQKNPLRCFSYNFFSANGWQNENFINLVTFALDYLTMMSETGQVQSDPQTTISTVCEDVVTGVSVMNLQDFPALQSVLDPHGFQQAQMAMAAFQKMRGVVQQWRQSKMMAPQTMMGQMPGMMPGAMPGMMPGMQPMGGMMPGMVQQRMMPQGGMMMPGMMQPTMPMAGMGGDPRFAGGGMTMQPQNPMGGVRFGMPGMPTSHEDQREVAKSMINTQREMMGGGGRWNKATDETVDRLTGGQSAGAALGMGSAFDSRMRAQAEQTPTPQSALATIAAHSSTPLTEASHDQTAMNTITSIYPQGYFRRRKDDAPEDQAFVMSLYKRYINDGTLPPDALSPYDTPPEDYLKQGQPVTTAPVPEVPSTAKAQRESAEPSESDPAAVPQPTQQATASRWWDKEEYQIPEAIPQAGAQQSESVPLPVTTETTDVDYQEIRGDKDVQDPLEFVKKEEDYTYEDEGRDYQWVPHGTQWYRPLYQPTRQVRMLKVYKDGRHSDLVVLDRNPEDIPNMDYAQHVLNTSSGRRERLDNDADRALAAQAKIKEATDAYYQGVQNVEANPSIVLDNPTTSFDVSLITEVEGAEPTVWMIGNVKRAISEKESGKSIDIYVSNALLYDAVYCRNEGDIPFLKAIYKLKDFEELHHHLQVCLGMVDKGIWETVNRRATIMLNQTLVLTMSLNEDVISPDFYANYQAIATGMAKAPSVVKLAWQQVQQQQLRTFFHEANEEDLKRNTDSVCYFLPDEKEAYLASTRYLASVCTFTQLSVDAADLDIALAPHEVAQVTETATPVLYKVAQAVFDATTALGDRKAMHHLIRSEDGVVYQLTHGALVEGSLLISKRQHLWVDAR